VRSVVSCCGRGRGRRVVIGNAVLVHSYNLLHSAMAPRRVIKVNKNTQIGLKQ
jgi:hypothetical protein